MFLTFDAHGVTSVSETDFKLDLSGVMDNDDNVVCADTLYTSLLFRLAKWALERGISYDEIFPLYIHDAQYWDNDLSKRLDAGSGDDGWLKEIAQFAWFVEQDADSYIDSDQVFAVVNTLGWKYVDFDDLKSVIEDDYSREFDDDYEDFAREWMSDTGDGLPDHLEHHFDYDSYGRDLVESYEKYEWNDRTFLYNQ